MVPHMENDTNYNGCGNRLQCTKLNLECQILDIPYFMDSGFLDKLNSGHPKITSVIIAVYILNKFLVALKN